LWGYWQEFIDWLSRYGIGDVVGILSLFISVVGFIVTVAKVNRSRDAANKAEAAANAARRNIRLLDAMVDFSSVIAHLEEIKRLHREAAFHVLPDRYASLRKLLILVREGTPELSEAHRTAMQDVIVNLANFEKRVERSLKTGAVPDTAKLNALVSADIDRLTPALAALMTERGGA
jgi:hypothetical protein